MSQFRVMQDGAKVILILNGRRLAELNAGTALETGKAIVQVAQRAEEWEQAERVTEDAALFLRATGMGLAYHSAIAKEAHTRAQWDSRFRGIPAVPGIPSAEKVGRPALHHVRGDDQ